MADQSDMTPEHKKRLFQLHAAFESRLEEMISTVQAEWQKVHACTGWNENTVSRLQQINHLVHRIRGSAGSFGYPNVSEAAAPLDELLSKIRYSSSSVLEQRATIEVLIDDLVKAFEKNKAKPILDQ